jgi:hypothetical protein
MGWKFGLHKIRPAACLTQPVMNQSFWFSCVTSFTSPLPLAALKVPSQLATNHQTQHACLHHKDKVVRLGTSKRPVRAACLHDCSVYLLVRRLQKHHQRKDCPQTSAQTCRNLVIYHAACTGAGTRTRTRSVINTHTECLVRAGTRRPDHPTHVPIIDWPMIHCSTRCTYNNWRLHTSSRIISPRGLNAHPS